MRLTRATGVAQLTQDHTANEWWIPMHSPPAWALLAQPAWPTVLPLSLPGSEKQGGLRALRLCRVQAEVDGRMQYADSPK